MSQFHFCCLMSKRIQTVPPYKGIASFYPPNIAFPLNKRFHEGDSYNDLCAYRLHRCPALARNIPSSCIPSTVATTLTQPASISSTAVPPSLALQPRASDRRSSAHLGSAMCPGLGSCIVQQDAAATVLSVGHVHRASKGRSGLRD